MTRDKSHKQVLTGWRGLRALGKLLSFHYQQHGATLLQEKINQLFQRLQTHLAGLKMPSVQGCGEGAQGGPG